MNKSEFIEKLKTLSKNDIDEKTDPLFIFNMIKAGEVFITKSSLNLLADYFDSYTFTDDHLDLLLSEVNGSFFSIEKTIFHWKVLQFLGQSYDLSNLKLSKIVLLINNLEKSSMLKDTSSIFVRYINSNTKVSEKDKEYFNKYLMLF